MPARTLRYHEDDDDSPGMNHRRRRQQRRGAKRDRVVVVPDGVDDIGPGKDQPPQHLGVLVEPQPGAAVGVHPCQSGDQRSHTESQDLEARAWRDADPRDQHARHDTEEHREHEQPEMKEILRLVGPGAQDVSHHRLVENDAVGNDEVERDRAAEEQGHADPLRQPDRHRREGCQDEQRRHQLQHEQRRQREPGAEIESTPAWRRLAGRAAPGTAPS